MLQSRSVFDADFQIRFESGAQMPVSPQRLDYLAAQIQAVHQHLRLLETVVTSPIGLTTDLQSLRESLPIPEAQRERDRTAFQDLARDRDAGRVGLATRRALAETLALVRLLTPADAEAGVSTDWQGRALKILERVDARLGAEVRQAKARGLVGLYVIVDPEQTNGRSPIDVAGAALEGGAIAIQLRDKKSDKGAQSRMASAIARLCNDRKALFFVNDHADIARICGADGVHVGQTDLPVAGARQVLRADQLVGTSNALFEEAIASESQSADYIAVGRMYETESKSNTRPAGVETLRKVKASVGVPVLAIGGINESNLAPVVKAGADAICVIGAVCRAPDPAAAARRLTGLIEAARQGQGSG